MMNRMMKAFLGALVGCLMASASFAEMPSKIEIVTEEFPPANFRKDGKITGLSTEVVEAIVKEAGIEAKIEIFPWARALLMVDEGENVAIFSMSRTAERESKYKWVGQLYENKNYVYGLPGKDFKINSIEDLKKYQIGAVNQDVREKYFLSHGFVAGKNLESVSKHELNYSKLKSGAIDLWPATDFLAASVVKAAGDDPNTAIVPTFEIVDIAPYSGGFLAFGPKTSDEVVTKFREAYQKIKANGTYDALQKKWHDIVFSK